jgi:hypothetical protein
MQVGNVYDELPMHCTLMHRFWSELSVVELASKVKPLFEVTPSVVLATYKRTLLGPKQLAVSLLELTDELDSLNMQLYELLSELGVEYTAPQWVGKGHVFHITDRESERLEIGSKQPCNTVYLIEVKVPGHDYQRFVQAKFDLAG